MARDLGVACVDVDAEIVKRHRRSSGDDLSVREIYRTDGGATFRELEADICREASKSGPVVIAAGGGLCDNAAARAYLDKAVMIALEAEAAVLFRRIMRRGIPSFMRARSREAAWVEFQSLHERRSAEYRKIAHMTIDTGDRSPGEVATLATRYIREGLNGGK